MKKLTQFLTQDIWRVRLSHLSGERYVLFRSLRVILLAFRGFAEDKCQLRASALTFYSLLSVVPVLAMVFGIAKGFGFETRIETMLTERMAGQEEVAAWLIQFAQAFLENTKGGVIAGVGIVLLFWAVIKVLGQIEDSFNDIWGVHEARTWARKLGDYLSIILICPVLLMVASSLTVFMTTQLQKLDAPIQAASWLSSGLALVLLKLGPFIVLWSLFAFVYMFMPNTKVSFKGGLTAGIVAGTLYQWVQWIYISFQVGAAKYNAVYGSFAALPLFLVWLQLSWLVVLLGAELSFAFDNDETYEFEKDSRNASPRLKRLLSLKITELFAKSFAEGNPPLRATDIAHKLEAPIRLIRDLIDNLVQAKILVEVAGPVTQAHYYQPARSLDHLTLTRIIDELDRRGEDHPAMVKADSLNKMAKRLETLEQQAASSEANVRIVDI